MDKNNNNEFTAVGKKCYVSGDISALELYPWKTIVKGLEDDIEQLKEEVRVLKRMNKVLYKENNELHGKYRELKGQFDTVKWLIKGIDTLEKLKELKKTLN